MKDNKNEIQKVCSFYVNEWHLTTMLLPYVRKTIDKNEKVLTILQKGIKENIEELLSKMNLKSETQSKILEISWDSNEKCKYGEVINQIKKVASNVQAINIITNGSKEYLKLANMNIEKLLKEITGKNVTVINCYDITKNEKIDDILYEHELILNTAGIKKISEVFTGYKKESNIKNKIG